MPALLTSTSSLPKCRVVAATTAAQLSSFVTSSGSNRAEAPMASATCRPSCSSTSAITTLAPSRANRRAVAAPMPDAAPEMMATLPASLIVSSLWFECCSTAGEVRPALLGEGPYRFLVVLGKVRLRLKPRHMVEMKVGQQHVLQPAKPESGTHQLALGALPAIDEEASRSAANEQRR